MCIMCVYLFCQTMQVMSEYHNINGKKVRISDHEPNFTMDRFRGSNDIEIYTVDACGSKLDIQGQIASLFEAGHLDEADLLEMYRQGIAKRATLQMVGVTASVNTPLAKAKALVDKWVLDRESNQQFLADLARNPAAFIPSSLKTAAQKESWIKYVKSKI